jgi:hypothetical protein
MSRASEREKSTQPNYHLTLAAILDAQICLLASRLLAVSGNSLLSTGAAYIGSALSQCSSLTVLNLDGNGIDDSGALNLANGIKANSSLHTLLVANNEIGNAGGMALVQCWQERQKRMRVIDMSGNNLSGKVMGEIQKIGKNVVRVSK